MNLLRTIAPFFLAFVLVLAVCALPTLAADSSCFANSFFRQVAGDRSRIIQLSVVFVILGIALLFKK